MFKLHTPQKLVEIAGLRAGGCPGEYPTLLFGQLFFTGDLYLEDPNKGTFNTSRAEADVHNFLDLCARTGVQGALTVLGETSQALIRYIDWIANLDYYTGPIGIDAPNEIIRLPAVAHAMETGLGDRVLYDSVHPDSPDEGYHKLQEYGVKYSVAMASNSQNMWPEGRLEVLAGTGNDGQDPGLLEKLSRAGIEGVFIDTAVFGAVETVMANAAMRPVKEAFGWPVGAGITNAVGALEKAQFARTQNGEDLAEVFEGILGIDTLANTLSEGRSLPPLYSALDTAYGVSAVLAGADYIWGVPMWTADYMIPAVAAADAMLGYYFSRIEKGKIPHKAQHPLYRFMR